MNNVVQPLTENEPQRDAADWQLAFGVSAIAVQQFDDKKPIQMVIEKGVKSADCWINAIGARCLAVYYGR